ncbi:uncharacterized protein LOC126686228 [Mercurialis annua]|uniref:uncharacterized protein LOC126686228 n=1 Tax=Mercurialis annua TaxID=3986 RepID=UPI00215F96B2|nr:uncharacterized protein LOC126686228 [Mercurialis annua]
MLLSSYNFKRAHKEAERKWCDLPCDILASVASGLGMIDLISFRSVCKDWKSASRTASAEIESSSHREPWFLFYGEESSQCLLVSQTDHKYTINIQELSGSTACLASNKGWLLLLREDYSVYFFCPFSRAKIELPKLDNLGSLSNYIATFSSLPTSQDCLVSITYKNGSSKTIELYVIRRGDKEWTKCSHSHENVKSLGQIKCLAYYEDELSILDAHKKSIINYYFKSLTWKHYDIVPPSYAGPSTSNLPFLVKNCYFKDKKMREKLGLEKNVSVSICGSACLLGKQNVVIFSENIDAVEGSEQERRKLKGVWIHPRFFLLPPDQTWASISKVAERKFCDLPPDILESTAAGLGIIDLISFRSVCKDWNSASGTASAEIECSSNREPWLLLYSELSSQCLLVSQNKDRYTINIPELSGSTACLASNKGWLLLLREDYSVYFFCPFSRAKIELPNLDNLGLLSNYIATFSSLPTSQDCLVSITYKIGSSKTIVLYVIRRGDKEWTKCSHSHDNVEKLGQIKCLAYYKDELYIMDAPKKFIMKYNFKSLTMDHYSINYYTAPSTTVSHIPTTVPHIPFIMRNSYFKDNEIREKLGLEKKISLSICGSAFLQGNINKVIYSENIDAQGSEKERLKLKGVWIHPRFFLLPPNQTW